MDKISPGNTVPRPRVAFGPLGGVRPIESTARTTDELIRRWQRRSRLAGVPADELWRTRTMADVARAVLDGTDLAAAATALGTARAGWFTEAELSADLRAAFDAAVSMRRMDGSLDELLLLALDAYRQECDASRVAGLVVDALTSLDTEEAFLVHLWDLVRHGSDGHLLVWIPVVDDDRTGRLSRPIRLGRELARCQGLVATAILESGVVVSCARTRQDAEAATERLALMTPGARPAIHPHPAGEISTITFGRWYTTAVGGRST